MPPHFTTLPREIRDSILELCLVVEGPINPYPAYYENPNPFKEADRKPDVALLKVNKAISAEATEIFYLKNVWVLNRPSSPTDKLWYIHREQVRHFSFSFDVQDLNSESIVFGIRFAFETWPGETNDRVRGERIHLSRILWLMRICQWKLSLCQDIGVKSLIINIRNLFCIGGCCRLEVIRRCCFDLLLEWARKIEKARFNKDGPALPGASNPKVTLVGFLSMADMTAARKVWERQWGPLNHYMNGDQICLEGFFLPREAKPVE